MTQVSDNVTDRAQRRKEWLARVDALVETIATWAQAEGWAVERQTKVLREKLLGEYEVPLLVLRVQDGEVQVSPVALHGVGVEGRVDLEAFPTLSRVKLVGSGQSWEIITDSNVPLRVAWDRDTFVQLVRDLLA